MTLEIIAVGLSAIVALTVSVQLLRADHHRTRTHRLVEAMTSREATWRTPIEPIELACERAREAGDARQKSSRRPPVTPPTAYAER